MVPGVISVEMKDLFERKDAIIWRTSVERFKKWRHFALLSGVDGITFHRTTGLINVVCLEIPDEKSVGPQE